MASIHEFGTARELIKCGCELVAVIVGTDAEIEEKFAKHDVNFVRGPSFLDQPNQAEFGVFVSTQRKREVIEGMAKDFCSADIYYDLMDCIDDTSAQELLEIAGF